MKTKLLLTVALLSNSVFAQISLEQTLPLNTIFFQPIEYYMPVELSNSGSKLAKINIYQDSLIVYNLNYSIFKAMSIPIDTSATWTYNIYYVSETLFDLDTEIEYMIVWTDTSANFLQHIDIVNEDGSNVITINQCGTIEGFLTHKFYSVYNTDNGTKLLVACTDSIGFLVEQRVYSLPGTYPSAMMEKENERINMSYPYPNPSNGRAKINFTLPNDFEAGKIVFYNLQGTQLKEINIQNGQTILDINNTDLASGTYLYQLVLGDGRRTSKKMVIIK